MESSFLMKHLSSYVLGPKQISNGHLVGLAKAGGMWLPPWTKAFLVRFTFLETQARIGVK
jgi:hypothetical protein